MSNPARGCKKLPGGSETSKNSVPWCRDWGGMAIRSGDVRFSKTRPAGGGSLANILPPHFQRALIGPRVWALELVPE